MRSVAAVVGITPMAIYRHYPGRTSLMNALADDGFTDLTTRLTSKRLKGEVGEQLTELLDVYLEYALQNSRLFELMFLKPRQGARRYPRDFKARRSPTANVMVEVVQAGMKSGDFREDDAWEVTFAMGALAQGLIMLYLGGRTNMSRVRFRAFYHRSLRRYIDGMRT